MKRYNVIAVLDKDKENVLMCYRSKEPYIGLYNLVGGKIETDDSLSEAYRELFEETSIDNNQIKLEHLMNIEYPDRNYKLEIYYGLLKENTELKEEANKLEWISLNENFADMNKFAGEGNIFHFIENIKLKEKIRYLKR